MKKTKAKSISIVYKERDTKFWLTHLNDELTLHQQSESNDNILFQWLPNSLGTSEEVAIQEAALMLNLEVKNYAVFR